jgi:hypothetical protein
VPLPNHRGVRPQLRHGDLIGVAAAGIGFMESVGCKFDQKLVGAGVSSFCGRR